MKMEWGAAPQLIGAIFKIVLPIVMEFLLFSAKYAVFTPPATPFGNTTPHVLHFKIIMYD